MTKRYVNFRDRAPFVNQDRIQESRAAKQEAKADAESRQRRKAQNRRAQEQRKLQAVCPDELWSHYQAECEKHGMTLRRGSSTKPIHWMFEDAETGARLLNYYPKRKTGCFARGKGFHVGDINAAIDLASKQTPVERTGKSIDHEYRQMFHGERVVPLAKPAELPEGFDVDSAVAAEFAFI